MMKKITLLVALFVTVAIGLKAQVLFYDDLSTDRSSDYTFIDADGRTTDPFLTNQGIFGDGSWDRVNFGSPLGVAFYSSSTFVGADSCMSTNDYMVLPALDFTNANNAPFLTIEAGSSQGGGEISVFVATSIAGAAPVAADFVNPAEGTIALTGALVEHTFDLSAYSGMAEVHIAVVNTSTECRNLIGVGSIKVKNIDGKDIEINTFSLIDQDISNADLAFNYSVAACGSGITNVDVEVQNVGSVALDDTLYIAYFYANSLGNIAVEDTILDFIASPLAAGATYVHTLSEAVDMSLFEVSVFQLVAFHNDDSDTVNNELGHIVAAPNVVDLSTEEYFNSFEFDFSNDEALSRTLGTFFENNGVNTAFSIADFSIYGDAADFVTDGTNILYHEYTGPGGAFPVSNNWAFTSCMTFDASKFYTVSFDYNTFQGSAAPHTINFGLATDYNSASVVETVLAGEVLDAEDLTAYSAQFGVANSGDYHFAIHDLSTPGYVITMDFLVIKELPAPNPPSVTNSWAACDSAATLVFNYSASNTYTIDWGDGSTPEVVTASPATHVYTPGTSYVATINVSNIAGNNSATSTIAADLLPAPTADFNIIQSGTADNSVEFTSIGGFPCFTYEWSFDDGNTGTGSSVAHTFAESGTYNVSVIVSSPSGQSATVSKVVTITGLAIETIDFVNGINVSPNPTSGVLNIAFELNSKQDVEITLVSLDGKVVSASNASNVASVTNQINTSSLAKGMYILNVTSTEGKFTRNIIVQ